MIENIKEALKNYFEDEKQIKLDWEIVQITNIGYATEEIILKRK